MKVSPVVAVVIIAVVAVAAVLFLWKGTSVGRYPPPPPIQSGLPGGLSPQVVKPGAGAPSAPGTVGIGGPPPGVAGQGTPAGGGR